jgi:serine/threonine protein kinase
MTKNNCPKKQALILRSLRGHRNVLRFISFRTTAHAQFQLFMEYVDGGELFDRIGFFFFSSFRFEISITNIF